MKTAKCHAVSSVRSRWSDRNPVKLRRNRPRLEWMEDRTLLSTFSVLNTGDGGAGSLRQAILDSNAATGATNTIDFSIPGSGVQTIEPVSPLPAITSPVLIDGLSQPGYAGTPLIELNGSQGGGGDGLTITGAGVTVRGLDIDSFSQGAGIHLTGAGATGDWIYGNFLGTDPTGTQAEPNDYGVEIDGEASDNLIGTNGDGVNDAAERNLISGNLFAGVWVTGQGTNSNAVAGNFIGTSVTGDVALDNGTVHVYNNSGIIEGGVVIEGGASGNRIGTDGLGVDDAGQRNVIAGTSYSDQSAPGITIVGTGTDGCIVAGNFIGTNLTGTIPLGIGGDGVFIATGASSNWIGVNPDGGAAVVDVGNVISGTGSDGVQISANRGGSISAGSNDNVVAGNKIGTDATGAFALGNSVGGVEIDSSIQQYDRGDGRGRGQPHHRQRRAGRRRPVLEFHWTSALATRSLPIASSATRNRPSTSATTGSPTTPPRRARDPTTSRTSRYLSRLPMASTRAGSAGARLTRPFASNSSPTPLTDRAARARRRTTWDR